MLVLDTSVSAPPLTRPLTYSQACIDQLNIDASLMCLPVFLSGCDQLLTLVGPSYVTRLWCVMEVFIFMRVKGIDETTQQTTHLKVKELSSDADLAQTLARFKAANAQCRYDRDRQRLLAVIEASFGTTHSFDELVLKVFNAQVFGVVQAARAKSGRNRTRGVSNPTRGVTSKTAGVEEVSVVVKE